MVLPSLRAAVSAEPRLPSTAITFVSDLEQFGDRLAIAHPGGTLTYRELAEKVHDVASRLGGERRLVLVAGANELDPLIAYLAALHGGHPVLMAAGDNRSNVAALVSAYDPDVVVAPDAEGQWSFDERRLTSAHELHPELALLLSTSGSTGSAKLVRLSADNLSANAESIAQYLDIRTRDRAATTLPIHYCYGLSVVHSYLSRGAALILTDLSVVDPCFWDAFRAHGGTSIAGVPYTFDLLDRVGFEHMDLPTLRYVTQAGGRLAPERVRRYAEIGRRNGWQFFVMYGQTEATARMAYLPPDRVPHDAGAIGVPIPGGSFELAAVSEATGDGEGELVYRGPNVMLGYAETAADLALGRTIHELRTGDLARRTSTGLYEVVGRRSRFIKLFGLRIDLDQVERTLAGAGVKALCTGDDTQLIVAVEGGDDEVATAAAHVKESVGVPNGAMQICAFAPLPRLPNGKPDYVTIRAHAAETARSESSAEASTESSRESAGSVNALYEQVLQCGPVDDDASFVSLGGDSLSYVELSVKLESKLGHLPVDWHVRPIRELVPKVPRQRVFKRVETNVVLRAIAIVVVVGTHVRLWDVQGGAHVLLAVAGYNFARFQLAPSATDNPASRMWSAALRVGIPSALWIGVAAALSDEYDLRNAFLVNNQLGSTVWDEHWRYWYLEAFVQTLLVLGLLFAIPAVRRLERRYAYAVAFGAFALGYSPHLGLFDIDGMSHVIYLPQTVFWVFALGWLAQRSSTVVTRLIVSAILVATIPGAFEIHSREMLILVGLLLLVWVPRLWVPWPLNRVGGVVAGASFYIYLTHPQIYPPIRDHLSSNWLAFAASIAFGVAITSVAQRATNRSEWWLRNRFGAWKDRRSLAVSPVAAHSGSGIYGGATTPRGSGSHGERSLPVRR